MGKFNAETAVEALEFDFTKYVDGCAGVIPEPTTAQLEAYFNTMRGMLTKVRDLQTKVKGLQEHEAEGDASEVSSEEMDEVLAAMDEISFTQYQDEMVATVADLCSQQPSSDQILALPFRVKQAFIQWVTGEFRPEGQAPTTRG